MTKEVQLDWQVHCTPHMLLVCFLYKVAGCTPGLLRQGCRWYSCRITPIRPVGTIQGCSFLQIQIPKPWIFAADFRNFATHQPPWPGPTCAAWAWMLCRVSSATVLRSSAAVPTNARGRSESSLLYVTVEGCWRKASVKKGSTKMSGVARESSSGSAADRVGRGTHTWGSSGVTTLSLQRLPACCTHTSVLNAH